MCPHLLLGYLYRRHCHFLPLTSPEPRTTTPPDKGKQDGIGFGHSREAINEREKMEAELQKTVVEPLALLAGLLANVNNEEHAGGDLATVGYLLDLIVNGIRKETNFQVHGLNKEALMEMIVEKGFEHGMFAGDGEA